MSLYNEFLLSLYKLKGNKFSKINFFFLCSELVKHFKNVLANIFSSKIKKTESSKAITEADLG